MSRRADGAALTTGQGSGRILTRASKQAKNRHVKGFRSGYRQDYSLEKGQASPNPGGRPRSRLLTAAYVRVLGEPFPADKQGRTFAEVIAHRIATDAARGNLQAAALLAERTEGRVRPAIDLEAINRAIPLPDPDNGQDLYGQARDLTERLRQRIALRKSLKNGGLSTLAFEEHCNLRARPSASCNVE